MRPAGGEGGRQLGAIVPLAGFDFGEFLDDLAADGGDMPCHGLALGLEAEAASPLGLCGNPVVGDEGGGGSHFSIPNGH